MLIVCILEFVLITNLSGDIIIISAIKKKKNLAQAPPQT